MRKANKLMIAAVLALALPTGALAAEADLQVRIDQLTKQMDDLKGQVQKMEDKQLGKWLTIGGKYEFRVDSLHGKTVSYSDAIGTMNNLVGGLVGSVAGQTLGYTSSQSITNPTGTAFIFQGKAGTLFTPAQLNTILYSYMPSAMYYAFTGSMTGANASPSIMSSLNTMTASQISSYLANNALTAQQSAILNTLVSKGILNQVMGMMSTANQSALNSLYLNDPARYQAAMVMAMQQFMGTAGGYLNTVSAYKPKNETIYTNKFSIDLKAQATKDVTVNAKLGMYKVFGSQNDDALTSNGYLADRVGVFDGTLGHIPSDSKLNVDRAYATWNNIGGEPIWFSVGRRPSTDGAPANFKNNTEKPGTGGTPALLVNYAFDGMTIGYAPDIDALPGFYGKVCYGRGFDSGFKTTTNSLKDTDMVGVAVVPIDTDPLRVWLQYNRGMNIFDFPVMDNTLFGNTAPSANLGAIDWYGAGAMSTIKNVGPGNLNVFADFGLSVTHPNNNVSANAGFQGLLTGGFFAQDFNPESKTGWSVLTGVRYDLPSKTKLGFEFNHGSKNWITFAPSADDMWTSKVGTRGNVYEPYIIQELDLKPISSRLAKAYFKVGYQLYDFDYTGSNNWVGAPVKISEIKATDLLLQAPVSKAHDVYGTFTVEF